MHICHYHNGSSPASRAQSVALRLIYIEKDVIFVYMIYTYTHIYIYICHYHRRACRARSALPCLARSTRIHGRRWWYETGARRQLV